jgi:[NiFe] hydrogenase diaphorase moiety large subunit
MVQNNLRSTGPVIFSPMNRGEAIRKALAMSPVEVIRAVKTARLRGCGRGGLPRRHEVGIHPRRAGRPQIHDLQRGRGRAGHVQGPGDPDRAGRPGVRGHDHRGYAIGADEGILYLRGEYAYLRAYLEDVLQRAPRTELLGKAIWARRTSISTFASRWGGARTSAARRRR